MFRSKKSPAIADILKNFGWDFDPQMIPFVDVFRSLGGLLVEMGNISLIFLRWVCNVLPQEFVAAADFLFSIHNQVVVQIFCISTLLGPRQVPMNPTKPERTQSFNPGINLSRLLPSKTDKGIQKTTPEMYKTGKYGINYLLTGAGFQPSTVLQYYSFCFRIG